MASGEGEYHHRNKVEHKLRCGNRANIAFGHFFIYLALDDRPPQGTVKEAQGNLQGTLEEPSRNPRGAFAEPARNPSGRVKGPTQNPQGTIKEPSRNPQGTLRETREEPSGNPQGQRGRYGKEEGADNNGG